MRGTVLALDLVTFFPAAWALSTALSTASQRSSVGGEPDAASVRSGATARVFSQVLLQPALILIDHGHFQYNCVSLGLAMGAAACLSYRHSSWIFDCAAAVLFSLSLNFKQMSLYYAPVFFVALLRKCCCGREGPTLSWWRLGGVGVATVGTFSVLWLPLCAAGDANTTCLTSVSYGTPCPSSRTCGTA